MPHMLLFAALVVAAVADLPLVIVGKGNPKAKPGAKTCVSWWGPNIVSTNSNTTLLWATCKTNTPLTSTYLARSTSAGRTWSVPELVEPELADPVSGAQPTYSRTTNTVFMTTAPPKRIAAPEERAQPTACAIAAIKYCGKVEGNGASCLACERTHKAELAKAGCTSSKLSRFCGTPRPPPSPPPKPTPPGPPPGGRPEPIWAHQLPPLTSAQLSKCETGLAHSTDEAKTWSKPELLNVNNSLGPHYGGSGLNHGIQIRKGPHAGRLAMARRMNCKAAMGDHNEQQYFHSFVIYSDDNGTSSSCAPEAILCVYGRMYCSQVQLGRQDSCCREAGPSAKSRR